MVTISTVQNLPLDLLRCPITGSNLHRLADGRLSADGGRCYMINPDGLPLFASESASGDARRQELHYDFVASAYLKNLSYPHTREYMAFLDRMFLEAMGDRSIGTTAEICCGRGDAFMLVGGRVSRGVGVDISTAMLREAMKNSLAPNISFVQGDATRLPLASNSFDSVFMLGGIHHVNDRSALFSEVYRILRPGGMFYFREPLSDFFLWRWLRAVIYRLSPALDHETERPLLREETEWPLRQAGLELAHWKTHGVVGFCLFMNSDILIVNKLFRYVPGIDRITRLSTRFDEMITSLPFLQHVGLQVVGVARKSV